MFCEDNVTMVDRVLLAQWDSGGRSFVRTRLWLTVVLSGQWDSGGRGRILSEQWDSSGRGFVRTTRQWWTRFCRGNGTVVHQTVDGTMENKVLPRQRDSGGRGLAKAMVERTEQVGSVGTWEEAATATGGR